MALVGIVSIHLILKCLLIIFSLWFPVSVTSSAVVSIENIKIHWCMLENIFVYKVSMSIGKRIYSVATVW